MSATAAESATWWDGVHAMPQTPIRDLVPALTEVADQPVPYGWLPARARTVFGEQLTTWSDLADETISSLLDRPKAGIGTVRAIILAARDAAMSRSAPAETTADAPSAIGRLLDRLNRYDYTVLAARGWALRPLSVSATAEQLGVAPVNVHRNQPRADRRLRDLLADPAHVAVLDHAQRLRRRLGPLTREHTAEGALNDLGLDLGTAAGQLLLHVAGPYTCVQGWLEGAQADGLATVTATLDAAFERWGAPTVDIVLRQFEHIGVPRDTAIDFIESQPGLRRVDGRWVRWGCSVAARAEAALHLAGTPLSAPAITAVIGGDYLQRYVRDVLNSDPRFTRATRLTWALSRWGVERYTGVFSEIAARIDDAGGAVDINALVEDMAAAFPDVAETSIRTYLTTPGFVTSRNMVRRRTPADGWPPVPPPTTIRGTFHNGRNEIRVAVPVTFDLLRGSGQNVAPAVATALGVHPGHRRVFTGKRATVSLFWPLSSTNGAKLASLRALATTLNAAVGDTIVLAFNVRDSTIAATLLAAQAAPAQRLRALLGKPARTPLADVARALRCRPDEVAGLLERRGDNSLRALLERSAEAIPAAAPGDRHNQPREASGQ
ncbi:hypothetical protein GCM10009645_20800 [Mycolicibacterium poriferae]|uniref:Uncharacterized protein n=3 Tax=Mycolicibacterium TaxID=1866885 RepID=A0A6N4VIQ4_9MYCO|nr:MULTISPECIES: hypothetical protein [Mycolicibacterium]BBX54501.1 hypothetical protein MPOR_55270 [Mycolicibacterium poriferae]